ncbi:ATP-binding cassette sub-family A member 3 [Eumeta japonica]|uniref:ATP-binding cassette sub-family A member 3 n=1 Tax=Eumeta variegata TaxID=151549 RepID=A0A4C1WTT0_EUMVA|nr:ATP-binding cassette sub-family A member 3 [Eumeta japonica]
MNLLVVTMMAGRTAPYDMDELHHVDTGKPVLGSNIEPTYGTVVLGGYNLSTHLEAARTQLGLCPQHNVIFDDLTVEEHIEFFSRLKGYSGKELKAEIDMLIDKLELQDKRQYYAGGLSGGQKRRLSVGVALSGGTRVVLLDEPTSGMDPSARRALWELLQREKKDRSILLTTHFMDEADVLGDRVAIMAHGRLQCVGSPYFLKRHYGVGYTLVVVKGESFDEGLCTKVIRKYITDCNVKEDRGTEVTYNLPNEYSHCFEKLLIELESKINEIDFTDYGLTATTLEDVFMRVGSDTGTVSLNSENDNMTVSSDMLSEDMLRCDIESASPEYLETKQDAVAGFRLLLQQFIAVYFKLFLVWSRSPWLIAMHLLIPLSMTVITLGTLSLVTDINNPNYNRQLTLNEGFSRTETLLAYQGDEGGLATRAAEAYAAPFADADSETMTLQWVHMQTPGEYYLEKAQDPEVLAEMRHSNLIGASFSDSAAVAWFSNFGYHDVAISVAGVHAALLRALVPDASLVVYNHPLQSTFDDQRSPPQASLGQSYRIWGIKFPYRGNGSSRLDYGDKVRHSSRLVPRRAETRTEVCFVADDNNAVNEYMIDDGNESEITIDAIMKALKHMKVGKAAGYDKVSSEMLRGAGGIVASLLYWLFNKCWKNHKHDEQSNVMAMQLISGMGSSLSLLSALFVMFYIKERVIRAKLLQKASGIQPAVLWGSAYVFDWCWFQVAGLGFIIACAAFPVEGLSSAKELGRLFLCLMVYGAAMLPLVYIFSYFFEKYATGFAVLFFVNLFLGVMGPQLVYTLDTINVEEEDLNPSQVMEGSIRFFPLYSFMVSITNLNNIAITINTCMSSCDIYSTLFPIEECTMQAMCEHLPSCCMDENPYFNWEEPGIGQSLTQMLISCLIFWAILMIFEYRLPQKVFNREVKPPPLDNLFDEDDDVREETRFAESVLSSNLHNHNLVAKKLTKYYKKKLAVNQVSFTVGGDECFGLLGVNGAGKTSTFKMLMGDETISSGDAYVQGHSVKTDIRRVHEIIGYCPQFDAIFEELTGRETIQLFGLLRGLRRQLINSTAVILARNLGFIEHLDKRRNITCAFTTKNLPSFLFLSLEAFLLVPHQVPEFLTPTYPKTSSSTCIKSLLTSCVHQYSGGNKRKLSTAIALLGSTRLVFLDEPTTGVDPAAKRQVWRAVRRTTRAGRGVVLTSHSMEECEALCSRLTIMVNGRFHCLGTPQHLKNKFSQGFTLTIKLGVDENESRNEQIDEVKNYVASNFHEPKLMEEFQGLLTYNLSDSTMAWSRIFAIMERARGVCNIDNYFITQTTLEQIFLQFTKYQDTTSTTVTAI